MPMSSSTASGLNVSRIVERRTPAVDDRYCRAEGWTGARPASRRHRSCRRRPESAAAGTPSSGSIVSGLDPASDQDRQLDDELASRAEALASGFDAAAMHRDQAPHQRQPDAEAALGAPVRAIDLREHVEHRARAAPAECRCRCRERRRSRARPPAGRSSQMWPPALVYLAALVSRLANTCVSRTASPATVIGSVGMSTVSSCPAASSDRAAGVDGRAHDGREIERFALDVDQAARDARHFEQIVHQPHEVADLALHDRASPARRRGP